MPTFGPTKYPRKKISIHQIPATKKSLPMKHPQEKILYPRNTREKKFWAYEDTMAPWHETRDVAQDPRNLAHSFRENLWGIGAIL